MHNSSPQICASDFAQIKGAAEKGHRIQHVPSLLTPPTHTHSHPVPATALPALAGKDSSGDRPGVLPPHAAVLLKWLPMELSAILQQQTSTVAKPYAEYPV